MKRTQRILRNARQCAGWASVNLAASGCAGAWAARVGQSDASGGMVLLVVALAVLVIALRQGGEALRLLRLVEAERYWDRVREIRPRL